jgi:hypothetical protein
MPKNLVTLSDTDSADEQRALTAVQFGQLAEVPAELEWLVNITNAKTRRAYKIDVSEFCLSSRHISDRAQHARGSLR